MSRIARRKSRRQLNIEAGQKLCKSCDGSGHGLGGFYCVECDGTGRAYEPALDDKRGEGREP